MSDFKAMQDWLYTDVVKEHFMHPHNMLQEAEDSWPCDGRGLIGNIKCGDQMLILIRVKDGKIEDCRWKTYGCASAIASTSILSDAIKGMKLEDAYRLKPQDHILVSRYQEALPLLVEVTLKKTLEKPQKNSHLSMEKDKESPFVSHRNLQVSLVFEKELQNYPLFP